MENTFTKAALDAVLLSIIAAPTAPTQMVMPRENYAMFRIMVRGQNEGWDRRRIKREFRKGSRSTYRGGPFTPTPVSSAQHPSG